MYLSGGHSELDHRGDLLGMQSLWPAQPPALRHHQERFTKKYMEGLLERSRSASSVSCGAGCPGACRKEKCSFKEKYLEGSALEGPKSQPSLKKRRLKPEGLFVLLGSGSKMRSDSTPSLELLSAPCLAVASRSVDSEEIIQSCKSLIYD